MKASAVRKLRGFRGDARLFELSEPLNGYSMVVVSASDVPYSGPETYIFGADSAGEIDSWIELPGSFRGALDHVAALEAAGYEVSL